VTALAEGSDAFEISAESKQRQIMSNRVMEQDARLINLEIKVSFAEDMVEELNKTVFRQQEQIDMLIREVDKLRQQTSEEAAVGSHGATDDLPPHY
jgi:SlyX protein